MNPTNKIRPPVNCTEQELWVWEKLILGEVADFTTEEFIQKFGISSVDTESSKAKTISSSFIKTILFNRTYKNAITLSGVKIKGALIKEPIIFEDITLTFPWWMDKCRFESKVQLISLKAVNLISFEGTTFKSSLQMDDSYFENSINLNNSECIGPLSMNFLKLKKHLFMSNAKFADVEMKCSRVDGRLDIGFSTITGGLNMNDLELKGSLFMNSCNFNRVDLSAAKVGGQIEMYNSTFKNTLNMDSLEVEQHLLMNDSTFIDVSLSIAKVGRQLKMDHSIFKEPLNMNGLTVGGQLVLNHSSFYHSLHMNNLNVKLSLMMNSAKFSSVDLRIAKVGETLEMNNSMFGGNLNLTGVGVTRSLFMEWSDYSSEVRLNGAQIGQQLTMNDSSFKGLLIMEHIHIGLDLLIRNITGPEGERKINLCFAEILGNLDISGSELSSLNLTGTNISGEFCLSHVKKTVRWRPNSSLILRNVYVGALQDSPGAWPDILDLTGFNYSHIGGLASTGNSPITDRNHSWFCEWLQKQQDYSPQPYKQLASVLLNMGHRKEANEILYAGRERERKNTSALTFLWLTVLNETIGYGYKISRAFVWAVFFCSDRCRRSNSKWNTLATTYNYKRIF